MSRKTDAMYLHNTEVIEALDEAIRTASVRASSTGQAYVICAMRKGWTGFRVISERSYHRWRIASPILERFRPLSHYGQEVA